MNKKTTNCGRPWPRMTLLLCMVLLGLSMTECTKHYVVVPGGETVTIQKQELDRIYSDNEALLQALEACKAR